LKKGVDIMGRLCYIILVKGMTEMKFLRVRKRRERKLFQRAPLLLSTPPTNKNLEKPLDNN
jgi:hypothetical protein